MLQSKIGKTRFCFFAPATSRSSEFLIDGSSRFPLRVFLQQPRGVKPSLVIPEQFALPIATGRSALPPDQIGQSPDPENVRPCWTLPTLPRRRGLFHQANYPESVAQSVQTVSVRSQNPGVGNKAQPTSFELPERTARFHVVRGSALRAQ